jgi:hypothetical protein
VSVFDLAVVGPQADAQAAAAALRLACGGRAAAVVVSDAGRGASIGLPCTADARRIAKRLAMDDAWIAARGRVVWVRPPRDLLVAAARRAAAGSATPVVLALTGPRDEIADVLLAESLRVVVLADPAGPVAALALAQLRDVGVIAEAREAISGPAIPLARLGWPGPARPALVTDGCR